MCSTRRTSGCRIVRLVHPLRERAAVGDGHIHFGAALHVAGDAGSDSRAGANNQYTDSPYSGPCNYGNGPGMLDRSPSGVAATDTALARRGDAADRLTAAIRDGRPRLPLLWVEPARSAAREGAVPRVGRSAEMPSIMVCGRTCTENFRLPIACELEFSKGPLHVSSFFLKCKSERRS
jgi:hypothetical protein